MSIVQNLDKIRELMTGEPQYVIIRMLLTGTLILTFAFLPLAAHAESNSTPEPGIRLLDVVRTTLEKQPDIRIMGQEAEQSRGALEEAEGPFDPVVSLSGGHDHTETPESVSTGLSKTRDETTSLTLKLSKKYRSGVEISPNVSLTRADTPEDYPQIQNTAGINFTVTVPLMRGLGKEATAAQEMAAEKEYAYSLHQMRYQSLESVFNAVSKYWGYQAAENKLEQLKASESRTKRHIEMVRALISADELPASELENMLANLESKTVSRVEGEQALYEAKQNLGLAMGLEFEDIEALPLPSDDFPKVDETEEIPLINKEKMIKHGLANRDDYLASRELQESREILVKAAKNELKPKLDLSLNAGYSGLREGSSGSYFITSMGNNIPGASASIFFTYELPYRNIGAQGVVLQKKSEYEKSRIDTNNLARNIASTIAMAFSDYKNSKKAVINAGKSAQYYQGALKKEREKVRLGIATLLDLITVEERMTNALLDGISVHMKYAVALARCRFETGTMMRDHGEQAYIDADQLTTLPLLEESKE